MGFDFLHAYATMDEIYICDSVEKMNFVINQCEYFRYNKLKQTIYSYLVNGKNVFFSFSIQVGKLISLLLLLSSEIHTCLQTL